MQEQAKANQTEPDFTFFLSTLAMKALISMGEAPNPTTKAKEVNLDEARYMINLIKLIQEKTKGNLNEQEEGSFKRLLDHIEPKLTKLEQPASEN
ncbi:MAG: hypothetical protein ACI9CF_000345 [Candidatus Omnitrophota bacterium]|jgi:hypothetical protein